jgi:hypothetical protein
MSDTQRKYFYDWEISGPNGEILVSLKEKVDLKDRDWRNSIDDLIFFIKEYPNQALMNEEVSYKLSMLRQQANKNKDAADIWKKVCKAIYGDGRKRKNKEKLSELKQEILNDIDFFIEIQNRIGQGNIGTDDAIEEYLTKDVAEDDRESYDKQIDKMSNHKNIFYTYKKIFDHLKKHLSSNEIISFFRKAAEHIDDTNATVDVTPEGRLLTFVKVNTWYVEGPDMTEGSD